MGDVLALIVDGSMHLYILMFGVVSLVLQVLLPIGATFEFSNG
jgi:hypothetical protein